MKQSISTLLVLNLLGISACHEKHNFRTSFQNAQNFDDSEGTNDQEDDENTGTDSLALLGNDQVTSSDEFRVLQKDPDFGLEKGNISFETLAPFALEASKIIIEAIENPAWQNQMTTLDINDDGFISPIDALVIINFINDTGPQKLPEPSDEFAPAPFYDPSGDGFISPLDALLVINFINGDRSIDHFSILSPNGKVEDFSGEKISWTSANGDDQAVYEVGVSTTADCKTIVVEKAEKVAGLETDLFDTLANGDYFACVTAISQTGARLAARNQGHPFEVRVTGFHRVFLGRELVGVPNGLIDPETTSNLRYFDLKCTEWAVNGGLISDWDGSSVVYKAIMSDDENGARERLGIRGRVIDSRGRLIAHSDEDLWDGNIEIPIVTDEYGELFFRDTNTLFSGTLENGEARVGDTCHNWTSNSVNVSGSSAILFRTDKLWINFGSDDCNILAFVFCASPFIAD